MGLDLPPPSLPEGLVDGPLELVTREATSLDYSFDIPVQTYEDSSEVPAEFLATHPASPDSGHNDLDLPLIDMCALMTGAEWDRQSAERVKAEIGKACEEWGFFQAINHGIPESLLDRLLEVTNEFFQLPLEDKEACAVPGSLYGYNVKLSSGKYGRPWNDTLRCRVRPEPSLDEDLLLPTKPPAYRQVIKDYIEGVDKLVEAVWTSLSEYLGLESTTLRNAQEPDSQLVIRLNYYPKCPEPEKVNGLSAHKDIGCITVLLQDEVGGLQVQKLGDESVWVDVKPKKGAVVVNVGNQVEILSNGRLKSVLHRAKVNQTASRISIAVFYAPGDECMVRPLPQLFDETHPVLYKEVKYGDYLPNFMADLDAGRLPHLRYEINR